MNGEEKRIKILHVDDEPNFLDVAKAFLKRENINFSIKSATSAEKGLELLKGCKYDVVISDYQMPGIDGLEFLQKIRERGNTIPFIIFTGKGREEVAMDALNKGANHYIQKGGDAKSLYGTLAHVIQETVEKKRADDKLAAVEKERQIILDSVPVRIFHIDRDSNYVFVNEFLAKVHGKKPEDFKGKSTSEIFPGEAGSYIKSDEEVLESGRPQIGIIGEICTPEGTRYLRLDKVPVKDAEGNITGIIGFELDITERKVAEDRINHLNAVLRAIRDVNELITREKDRDKLLTGICAKLIETRGYHNAWIALTDDSGNFVNAKQAGFGDEFLPIIDKLKRGELMNCARMALAQSGIRVIENPAEACSDCPLASRYKGRSAMAIRLEHRDNVYGILEVSVPPQLAEDEEEQVLLREVADDIAFALYDIETEAAHKVLAEALWEVKERYRILYESAKEGIFIEDLDGAIVEVNQTACEMLGYTSDELTNLHISDIVAPGVTEQQSNFVRQVQEKGYAFAQVENVRKDGTQISVELSASIIAMEDKSLVVVIARDITERKQMEEHITRLNAMLRTIRNISELIMREKDRDLLLKGICEKLIETEGYHNAWIALMDAPGNFVSAAQAGLDKEFSTAIDKLKHGELMNCAQMALTQSGIRVIENPADACSNCPLASSCEGRSGMTIRLEYGNMVYGVLKTSVASHVATDEEEQVLFKELADDIAFALHDFEIEGARQRAVDALLDSEEKYRTMVEYTGTGVAILEEDDTVSFVNKEFEKITGYGREEVEGRSWTKYIVKEDLEAMKSSSGVPSGSEIRLIAKGGEIKDILLNVTVIPGTRKSLASLIDITKRKQAEEALQESEREHQTILDSVPVGLFHLDAESRFVRVNKALAEGYGMRPEDFKGRTSKELFPGVGEEYIKSDKEVLERGKPQAGVLKKIKTPEGDKWVRLDTVPLKDAVGNVTGIIGFELDVSKRIQAEEELRNAHKELQDIIEFLPDATFVIDRDKKVIAWNRALEEMTKVRKEEIVGKGDYAYAVPFYGVTRPILVDLIFSHDEEIESRYDYVERKGDTLFAVVFISGMYGGKGAYLWCTATPLFDSDGNIVGAIESIRDITESKRAEEERERFLKELEAKNTEMERFTYTVSHDLRSPLFAIQGFTTLAREDLEQGTMENLASDLERTENAATKMDHLLNDTLQLSRVGRVANPPEEVPFQKIVEGSLELVAAQIKTKGVDVSMAEDFPPVHVDRVRIEEMLMNLIGNSIKYMGEQSRPKIEIGYRVEGGETIFFVKDNGLGIDPRFHEQVFELFYKVDKTSTGTGAGLAIVKRIIEVHGGRIWIESEKGKGCTVCFTLPVQ
jgi:PAS domain S-box-containing protein